jgi:hypothetical protein
MEDEGHGLKRKKFSQITGLYTGGDSVSAGSGRRTKGEEEKGHPYGYVKREECGADF